MRERARSTLPGLTDRERQVLELVWRGLTNEQIGEELKISVKTVEAHRGNVLKKWRVKNAAQMLRAGITHGVLKFRRTA